MTETADQAAFRRRCRSFLATVADAESATWAEAQAYQRALYAAGLAGLEVPADYGGQGLDRSYAEIFAAEAAGRRLAGGMFVITLGMCVPVLLAHGTVAQCRRHIPAMLAGRETWCQMFSEPNAGSDVAAAQMRAVADGDEWILDGQKVWTSSAQYAAFGMCLARTDWDVPKHRGLTMFIVPMDAPGVTIRPLVQATGDRGFNEVFCDGVRLSPDRVIGEPGRGWSVALAMLMNERSSLGAANSSPLSGHADTVLDDTGPSDSQPFDALRRQQLADLFIGKEILRVVGERVTAATEAGRTPGAEGSVAKLFGSDLARRAANVHAAMRGAAAIAWDRDDELGGAVARSVMSTPSLTIAGGTSEIQRNIIGERLLGLPKEPSVDSKIPFRDVPKN